MCHEKKKSPARPSADSSHHLVHTSAGCRAPIRREELRQLGPMRFETPTRTQKKATRVQRPDWQKKKKKTKKKKEQL